MIVDERITAYINSLDMGNTELLNEIEEEAKRDFVPVIRREMQMSKNEFKRAVGSLLKAGKITITEKAIRRNDE